MTELTITWSPPAEQDGIVATRARLAGRVLRVEQRNASGHRWLVTVPHDPTPLAWGTAERVGQAQARAVQALALLGSTA